MTSYIDELEERLGDYSDEVMMEIIEDSDLGEVQNLLSLAYDILQVAKDLAKELEGMEGR
ncbi:MAG: hypothetical protein HXL63_06945 [Thermobifida sp.]|nr:hypothetical protein [Thermobifida sp.]